MLAVVEGRRDHRRAGEREQIVLRADEDAHAFAAFRPVQKIDDFLLGFEIGEEKPNALEVVERRQIFQKIGLAAHDELVALAGHIDPAREPRLDETRGQFAEFRLGA